MNHLNLNCFQVDILIPDVLRPIPPSLTQAIRNFAKVKVYSANLEFTANPSLHHKVYEIMYEIVPFYLPD